MKMSYKPLWILLLKRDMTKTQLREKAGISTRQLAKMGRNEGVNADVLIKICEVLDCSLDDIVEMLPDRPGE